MTTYDISNGNAESIVRDVSATSPKRAISSFLQHLWPRPMSAKIIPKLSGKGSEASSSSHSNSVNTKPVPRQNLQQGRAPLRIHFSRQQSAITQPSGMRLKRRGSTSSSLYNLTFLIATRRSPSVRSSQLCVNLKMHSATVFGAVTFLRAKAVILMTLRFLVSTAAQFVHTMHPKCPRQFMIIAARRDKGRLTVLAMCGTLKIDEKSFFELSLREERICDTLASEYGASTQIELNVGNELHFCFAMKGNMKPGSLLVFQSEFTAAMSFLKGQLADIDAALQTETRLHEAERSQKVRDLDVQTNRFLRHEVKNGIIGALADLDALRDTVRDILMESRSGSDSLARSVPCSLGDRSPNSSLGEAMDNICENRKIPNSAELSTDSEKEDDAGENITRHNLEYLKLYAGHQSYGCKDIENREQRHSNAASCLNSSSSNHLLSCHGESDTSSGERLMRYIRDIADDLARTTDLVTSSSILRAVLQGNYTPRLDTFDASSICRSIHSDSNAVTASPNSILVETDSRLFRFIVENAVSNARKYGLHCGPIAITMRTRQFVSDEDQPFGDKNLGQLAWLNVCVENKPGPGHERLLALDNCDRVFDQGTRFHDSDGALKMHQLGGERSRISAGDGGWIMRQSAKALGGYCSIAFCPTNTIFSLDVPARVISEGEQRVFDSLSSEVSSAKGCAVAADSSTLFLVALDDAPSQCRLLERYFRHIGPKDRSLIWQATSSVVDHFVQLAMDLVRRECARNPKVKIVFFLDDRLSVRRADGTHLSASGMALGIELRSALYEANLEGRTLLLVRSANDDPADIEIYCDRLHGLFPKLPMSKSEFTKVLRSHLDRRFGRDDSASVNVESGSATKGDAGALTKSRS